MSVYGLSDTHVLEMPIDRFWAIEANINRMRAERDMRTLRLLVAAQGQAESIKEANESLASELGSIVVEVAHEREVGALDMLKQLSTI